MNTIEHTYVKQAIRQALQEVAGERADRRRDRAQEGRGDGRARVGAARDATRCNTGFIVEQFTINELRAPPAVIEAINQKNVMQQQALTSENEVQKNKFQAQGDSIKAMGHAKAILAEAEAQAPRQPPARREHHADARAV